MHINVINVIIFVYYLCEYARVLKFCASNSIIHLETTYGQKCTTKKREKSNNKQYHLLAELVIKLWNFCCHFSIKIGKCIENVEHTIKFPNRDIFR